MRRTYITYGRARSMEEYGALTMPFPRNSGSRENQYNVFENHVLCRDPASRSRIPA